MGTKPKMIVLMSAWLRVSIGPIATASESAALRVPRKYAVRATRRKPSMFPVTIPATIVSPPRTSGLPAARATLDSRLPSSRPARTLARRSGPGGVPGCVLGGREGGIVVRMVGHLFDILHVADKVLPVEHKNRPALDAQILDQRAVGFAEGTGAMVGQHLDPIHSESSAPALLRERQVHADGEDIHAGHLGRFFVEALGLQIA